MKTLHWKTPFDLWGPLKHHTIHVTDLIEGECWILLDGNQLLLGDVHMHTQAEAIERTLKAIGHTYTTTGIDS